MIKQTYEGFETLTSSLTTNKQAHLTFLVINVSWGENHISHRMSRHSDYCWLNYNFWNEKRFIWLFQSVQSIWWVGWSWVGFGERDEIKNILESRDWCMNSCNVTKRMIYESIFGRYISKEQERCYSWLATTYQSLNLHSFKKFYVSYPFLGIL